MTSRPEDDRARTEVEIRVGGAGDAAPDPIAATEASPLEEVSARQTLGEDRRPLVGGRYELLGMLGAGGMGTVYRARDRELDEIVALKVLRKELAAAPGMLERFRREVKLARRVTHRNVARMFDIGDHEGDRFLTMELIEGEMLGNLVSRRGSLPVRDACSISRDVCAGLAAAHSAGVLHRDLKPENVIIARDRGAVITDFGIARALAQAEMGRTGAGAVLGTPAYMAPEQVEGAADLDARADLYAVGAMLFELLTGVMPWRGDSVIAVAAARLLREPPDPRAERPDLPAAVASLVLRLMARRRDDRFASADEIAAALDEIDVALRDSASPLTVSPSPSGVPRARPSSGSLAVTAKTVAVLPFVNLGSREDAYLAELLGEDLLDLLSVVRGLRVRPRGETARFTDAGRDVREVGRTLGVDVVVDASIRRVGDTVRVAVRLVTVEDGFQLWARRFDRPSSQVLTVADEAARAIAATLASELDRHMAPIATDPVAQDHYMRARHLMNRGTFEAFPTAVALLEEAHARAPEDPRIAGTYALAIARAVGTHEMTDSGAYERARAAADETLAVDPEQPEALVALAFLHLSRSEHVETAEYLRRAIDVAPNAIEALDLAGRMLVEAARIEPGMRMLRRALAIYPEMQQPRQSIARVHALLGEHEAFLDAIGPLPDNASDRIAFLLLRGRVLLWRRDKQGAEALAAEVARLPMSPYAQRAIGGLLRAGILSELTPEDRAALDTILPLDPRLPKRRRSFYAQVRAEVKLTIGDVPGGLEELVIADQEGLADVLWLERCELFAPLRRQAAFEGILARTQARVAGLHEILETRRRR